MLTLTIGKQNKKSLPKRKRPLENHTNETKRILMHGGMSIHTNSLTC